jgi:hypothetical protein
MAVRATQLLGSEARNLLGQFQQDVSAWAVSIRSRPHCPDRDMGKSCSLPIRQGAIRARVGLDGHVRRSGDYG